MISRKKLKDAASRYGDIEEALDVWFRIAKSSAWRSLADVRATFASADAVGIWTVFNVRGNNYRLITEINYRSQRIFVRHVLTHAEYDKERRKR